MLHGTDPGANLLAAVAIIGAAAVLLRDPHGWRSLTKRVDALSDNDAHVLYQRLYRRFQQTLDRAA